MRVAISKCPLFFGGGAVNGRMSWQIAMSKWPILQWHFITISVIHNYGNIDTLENFLTLQAQLSKIIYTKAKDEYYYSLLLIDDYNNSQLS